MKVISFLNQKGGVGKTSSTINIGAGLAKLNKKVLLIDLDPQASLSCSLGIESPQHSVYDWIKKDSTFNEVVINRGTISVIPSSIDLSAAEYEFRNASGKESMLKNVLSKVKNFDYVFIDCPPSLGFLTINALAASNEVYIPVQTEFLALQGLGQLIDTLSIITQRINPGLKIGGIFGTRYNRRKINKDVLMYLAENFKDKTFKTAIRENISLAEAPSFAKDIFSHAPNSNGSKDYFALCKEILAKTI